MLKGFSPPHKDRSCFIPRLQMNINWKFSFLRQPSNDYLQLALKPMTHVYENPFVECSSARRFKMLKFINFRPLTTTLIT